MPKLAALLALLPLAAASGPQVPPGQVELVVVFQKGISGADAEAALQRLGQPFHSGSDSSRGKGYFYAHGPQYLVRLPSAARADYERAAKKEKGIAEVYEANWDIQKD